MILEIKEYLNKYNSFGDYLLRLSKPNANKNDLLVKTGMIKWSDDSHNWSGPFEGDFVFFKITDFNFQYPALSSVNGIKESEKTQAEYSSYSWPYLFCEKVLGENWHKCNIGGTVCKRSTLTVCELKKIIKYATENDNNAIEFYFKKLDTVLKNLTLHLTIPSKEFPVSLYMCGTDDTSYSKLFESAEEALAFISGIEKENNFDFVHKHMIFTN